MDTQAPISGIRYRQRFTFRLSRNGNGVGASNLVTDAIDATQRIYFAGPAVNQVWKVLRLSIFCEKASAGPHLSAAWYGSAAALATGCLWRLFRPSTGALLWDLTGGAPLSSNQILGRLSTAYASGSQAWMFSGQGAVSVMAASNFSGVNIDFRDNVDPLFMAGGDQIQYISQDAHNLAGNTDEGAWIVAEDWTNG